MSGVETLLTNIIVYNILLKLIVTLTMLFTNIGLAALHFNIKKISGITLKLAIA